MFIWTLSKRTLRKAGAFVLCLGCLAGTVAAVNTVAGRSVAAAATTQVNIGGTGDIGAWFSERGIELDLSTAAVDSVKIPRRWDDSFLAFNTVVAQSGMALDGYKGKTVEKWTALCPGRSSGEEKVYGVMLVYKEQAIGAYLLGQPSGEVTGLTQAAMALTPEESEAAETFGQDWILPEDEEQEAAQTAAIAQALEEDGDWPVE